MLSGTLANIAVKIFGDDLRTLRLLGRQAQTGISGVPGVVDLSMEQQTDIPTLNIRPDPLRVARYSLPAGEVSDRIETALLGTEVGRIFEGQVSFPLVAKYEDPRRPGDGEDTLAGIREMLVDTPAGPRIPLGSVANIQEDRSPNFIMREGVQRRIVVQCNVVGRDLRSTVQEIEQRVGQALKLPQGYRIEYGGQFESLERAYQRLTLLGIGVIVGIFLILGTAFGSYKDALIIMLNLPLALVGGVVGAYLAGGVLSVASIVGFITLFGIATRNGMIDDLPHSTPSSTRRNGSSRRRHARCGREARSHTDDRVSCRFGAGTDCPRDGKAWQRNSGSDGDRDLLRVAIVHGTQHGGCADSLLLLRERRVTTIRWLVVDAGPITRIRLHGSAFTAPTQGGYGSPRRAFRVCTGGIGSED